jgi:20S proteasome subunit alpha 5
MAIGSGSEGAATALQEGWRKDLTLAEAEVLALGTLKQVWWFCCCVVVVC